MHNSQLYAYLLSIQFPSRCPKISQTLAVLMAAAIRTPLDATIGSALWVAGTACAKRQNRPFPGGLIFNYLL